MYSPDRYILLGVVLLNYLAQVPYYFHQYYFPHHIPPSPVGTALLLATLVWFVIGYRRYTRDQSHGKATLLSFLITQALFYGHSVIFGLLFGGGVVAQLKTPSPFLLVIFLIGDLNFVVAAYYSWRIARTPRATI